MFRALRVEKRADAATTELVELGDDDLMPGDVTVDVEYSGVNFKDGLAMTGRPGVIRDYPLIPGIDLVGTIAESRHPLWSVGDAVILNGYGIGEIHNGGLAERARVSGDWLVALPDGVDARSAAAAGTAGFTAMLSVLALERKGVRPGDGDVLVTGAAGGVGSIAIAVLAGLGHRVVASTGRDAEADFLSGLGAADVIGRIGDPAKPLQSQSWAAVVDSVGSHTLVNAIAQTRYGGTVTACGLAQGADLPGSVLPFILRGVTLAGINSVQAPKELRVEAWQRLAADLDQAALESITTSVPLAEAPAVAERILAGQVRGRTLVDVRA